MIQPTIVSFSELERRRSEYKLIKVRTRDGFTSEQQIAMATIHNQQVHGGSPHAIMVILCKPTLRALWNKGVIDVDGRLTERGDALLRKWSSKSGHVVDIQSKRGVES